LSTLTKLTLLVVRDNPTLTDKTCPVKPESICTSMILRCGTGPFY